MKSYCKTNIIVKEKRKREECDVKIKRLSEAIILQAIEDLWITKERERCINFFTGEEFNACAAMAGMNYHEKVRVLDLVRNIVKQNSDCEGRSSHAPEKKTGTVHAGLGTEVKMGVQKWGRLY